MINRTYVVAALGLPLLVLQPACSKTPVFTDPVQAPSRFNLQGEFKGNLDGSNKTYGAQVIALGGDDFQTVLYPGGLPGDGWERGDERQELPGNSTAKDFVEFKNEKWSIVGDPSKLRIARSAGQPVGTLRRVERRSPLLGKKPPAGAIVLFDGSGVEHFFGAKMTADKLLVAGATTKDRYDDCTLHLEFRTPFMPEGRGQGRGNSGVYLQNRYEVQILDSFGLEGADNECGGLYKVSQPKVNMCLPPLAWQSYDIEFTAARYKGAEKVSNARITVMHNGAVIQSDVELPGATAGGEGESPEPGPLLLQDHGDPVHFRNVWIVPRKRLSIPAAPR